MSENIRVTDTAYIKLPGYPEETVRGIVARSVDLYDLMKDFKGPRVMLEFDAEQRLIGIEILVHESDHVSPS